ncbi:MAG: cysteine desulfurase family protein [Chitinophagaceae bacterium]
MNPSLPIYLDYNATTPCDPQVLQAMLPYFSEQFGNAASHSHYYGWQAREAVAIAREQVAALIGATERELVFTSGATEAVNLAIKGVYAAYCTKGKHIITTAVEHHAVLDSCARLEKMGAEVSYLPVNENGWVEPSAVEAAIRPETILIAVMHSNNETGTLMPVREIGEIARQNKIIFFSDASQSVGKIPVDIMQEHIDLLACSAHKFYGPKGVGALFVRRRDPRVSLIAQMDGGGHERGFRSGTLNVPGIVGMGKAAEIAMQSMEAEGARLSVLRDQLEQDLLSLGQVILNSDRERRLPHVTNLSFAGVEGQALMRVLSRDLAVSSGSACTSAIPEPSYVLRAIGRSDELAGAAIRLALGRPSQAADVQRAADLIRDAVLSLRQQGHYISH